MLIFSRDRYIKYSRVLPQLEPSTNSQKLRLWGFGYTLVEVMRAISLWVGGLRLLRAFEGLGVQGYFSF